ncbi:ATP-binding protein [Thiovibrio sp. JS02]
MKLKVFIGLIVLSLCFIFGGLYITEAMNRVIANLQDIIILQQVEFQRKTLLSQIKEVQTDLLLKDSPHAASLDTFVRHGEAVAATLDGCFRCHHPAPLAGRIGALKGIVEGYQKKLSRVYTLRANADRLGEARKSAFAAGEHLQYELNKLFLGADEKIAERTGLARQTISASRELLIVFVTIGPVIILLVSVYFFGRFTRAVTILSEAIRKVQDGNLDYRIKEKLDDEFHHLAEAFNRMGISLKEQCRRVESMQQRYRVLFESAGDAIFILEAEGAAAGRIISANKAAADMHGYSVDELLSMHIGELDDAESAAEIPGRVARILQGEWLKAVVNHRRKDGTVFPIEISAGLLEYDGHKYVLAFDRDITERIKAEEALQRARQLAMVGEMAAGLAHEIKNPLAGIKVSIEILASELTLAQEDKEVFLRVVQEVNRIETLLKNLLSYARPPKPHIDAVQLNVLLMNSVKNAEMALKSPNYFSDRKKEIRFVTELAQDIPTVSADSSQLQQIFLNLFLNGIEAIPEAGVITVRSAWDQAGEVRITIADTGRGFDEEGILKAFQPFYTTKSKGSGLGLAICKRLVEQHHGRIDLISKKGEGAAFVITLPVQHHHEGDGQ